MTLNKINHVQQSIKDIAYNNLKEAVILGKLKPGEQLSEEKLAQLLGISRTPLREAIQILINDRWIVREKNRIKVAPITENEITNLFLIRERLEALSAYQATLFSTSEFIDSLYKTLEKMSLAEKNEDADGVLEMGQEFHSLIIKQSQNEALQEILYHVLDQIRRYRHLGVQTIPGRSKSAVEEHELIVKALERKDADNVEEVMREHIASSKKSIILSDKYSRRTKNEFI